MKTIIFTALLLTLFALILPIFIAAGNPIETGIQPDLDQNYDPDAAGSLYYERTGNIDGADASIPVTLLDGDEVLKMNMSEYLVGAVAAEMPASFEMEALKAQAIALRTYALYKMLVSPAPHAEADLCSDSACCAAWKDNEYLREKWGEDYDMYYAKISDAVTATDGIYISYEDEPALAVFHSSSYGATEESASVWNEALPYLVSVESPETAEDVPNFISTVTVSAEEFSSTILAQYPSADFSGDISGWITDEEYTESGRLSGLSAGGVYITGAALRSMFSLRSTAVSFDVSADSITMTCSGYGHGVGMSQYGANVLARDGSTYEDILAKYYPGTALQSVSNLDLVNS